MIFIQERAALISSFINCLINQQNLQIQTKHMYYNFWNNTGFPTGWQLYIPYQQVFSQNCAQPAITETCIQEVAAQKQSEQKNNFQKKTIIDLSENDLINAGYEQTKKLWSQEEDQLLIRLVQNDKIEWKQIEKHIPQRTQKMCYSRYRRLLSQTKQTWTKQQDQMIKKLVQQFGQNWKQYTIHFKNRSSKQIKQRYLNYLRPEIKRDQWEIEEDMKIIQCINKYGKKWKKIEEELGNRTDNQIKNRYYGRLKILFKNKIVKQRRKKKEIHNV